MTGNDNLERLQGRVEVLEYLLNMYCDREMSPDMRMRMNVMLYSYKSEINEHGNRELTGEDRDSNGGC